MRRLIISLATMALVAACSDMPSTPTSSLQPGKALLDRGDPPPPPVAAEGFAEFNAFEGDNSATTCFGTDAFAFQYEYVLNNPGNNAFLHIRVPARGLDVAFHQTNNKIDGKGVIIGPDFTYSIQEVSGGIKTENGSLPSSVTLNLVGTLTRDNGAFSCTANATLTAHLVVIPD